MGWFTRTKDKIKEGLHQFTSVLSPYLLPNKRKEHIVIVSAWAGVHLVEFGINAYFVHEAASDNVEESISKSLGITFGNLLFAGSMFAFKMAMSNYMIHSIGQSLLQKNGLEGWLENNASVGIDFVQSMEEGKAFALSPDVPVERILTEHIKAFSEGTVRLSFENISRIISSGVSLYVIGSLTNLNTAAFYLAIGGGLVALCSKLDQAKIKMALEVSGLDDTINARLTHIRERAPQVLALQGERREVELIHALMEKRQTLATRIFWHEARNNSAMYITFFGLMPLISIIATKAPSVLQAVPSGQVASFLFQQHAFQLLINFFVALENHTKHAPKFHASLYKVYSLQKLFALWCQEQIHNNLVQEYPAASINGSDLVLNDLTVNMPTRADVAGFNELLKNTSLTLTPGEWGLLGPSNAGKSTIFKAIVGLWPHASGKIIYPCAKNEIRFIPQETFIPYNPTLFEMIIYPASNPALFNRDEIIHLMRELNLLHLVSTLDEKRDLKMLSRGEQQRVAIISAIVARPKLLLMDEATASIDKNNKRKAQSLIQTYLPDTLIIIIDHSPLDETLVVVPNESVQVPEQGHDEEKNSGDRVEIHIEMTEMAEDHPNRWSYKASNYAPTHFQPVRRDIRINTQSKQLEYAEETPDVINAIASSR